MSTSLQSVCAKLFAIKLSNSTSLVLSLFENIRKQGFTRVRVDGEIKQLTLNLQLDRYRVHDIEVVIDNILVKENSKQRLVNSLRLALKQGKGTLAVFDIENGVVKNYSKQLMCPTTGIS